MRSGTVLPHKTGKLAIPSERGLEFTQITGTEGLSLGFTLWLMTERKRTKISHVLMGNLIKKEYIYSTLMSVEMC